MLDKISMNMCHHQYQYKYRLLSSTNSYERLVGRISREALENVIKIHLQIAPGMFTLTTQVVNLYKWIKFLMFTTRGTQSGWHQIDLSRFQTQL